MKELSGYQPIGDEEIDAEWRKALQQQFAQVATERRAKEQELQALPHEPASEGPGDVSLLEQLPVHTGDLLALPEDLQRQLYDAFHLQIRYDQPKHQVTLRVTVSAATVDSLRSKITSIVAAAEQQKPPKSEQTLEADAVASASRVVSHVVGAPGRIRTCATASGGMYPTRSHPAVQQGERRPRRARTVNVGTYSAQRLPTRPARCPVATMIR